MERSPCGAIGRRIAVVGLVTALSATAVRAEDRKPIELYGFAQADFIMDVGGRLDPDWDDAFRVSKICIDGACGGDGQTSVSVKQSRFGVKGGMPTGESTAPLEFKFEFDLFGTGDDAGQTTFHLRHAYGVWGQFLAGRTDSVFQDGDTFPNTLDFWGPPGMVAYRNMQIRWTPFESDTGHFAVAIERPSNDIDPGNIRLIEGFENLQVQNDEEVPDLTAHYRYGGNWGHVQLSGILRKVGYELRVEEADDWIDGDERGWGINLTAAFNLLSQDKLLLQVVHGEGIASYMNDGGSDLAPRVTFDLAGNVVDVEAQALPLTGVAAYYEHYWNERWSSTVGYSLNEIDNTNFQEPDTFHKAEYASGNLMFYPADNLMFGAEVLWGKRTVNDGANDDDVRLQLSAKYTFGTRL